jgi:hypothetical protein
MRHSTTLDLDVPDDFPADAYDKVVSLHNSIPYGTGVEWRKEPVEQLRSGWLAVAFRFLAMTSWDEEWRQSVAIQGVAPPMPVRVTQESSLFAFFASACAVLESACYAVNAARVLVVGEIGGLSPAHQRLVDPGRTADLLRRSFPEDPLTRELRAMLQSDDYRRLGQIRNVLSHRTAPPRTILIGVRANSGDVPADWGLDIHGYERESLNDETTGSPRRWVGNELGRISEAFVPFLRRLAAPGSGSSDR